jgi:arylsulfatase A
MLLRFLKVGKKSKRIFSRHVFTVLTALLFLINAEILAQREYNYAPRPNIIIYLTDDLGYGDLSVYGHPFMKTPHLDKFAGEGVLMTDMHAAATVCSPSRAAILTGRNGYRSGYYNITGFFGTTLNKDEITLPQLLQKSGYETAFFGKWHLSRLEKANEATVNEMGFDFSLATSVNAFNTGPHDPDRFIKNGIAVGEKKGWYVDILTDEAIAWMSSRQYKDRPFFMMLATHEPHTPIDPPKGFTNLYENEEIEYLSQSIKYGGVSRPKRNINGFKKEYYGTVSQVDAAFGKLMDFLDKEGLSDNTLVIFTSDNGPEYPVTLEESNGEWEDPIRDKSFGTPGELRGMKRFPYEGGHRVPGLARWPGHIPAGLISDELFNGTDFLPTLCNLAGVALPEERHFDGANAFNAFLGKKYTRATPPIWFFLLNSSHMPGMVQMSMRHGDYTLIGKLTPERKDFPKVSLEKKYAAVDWLKTAMPTQFELYNIKKDLAQQNDLSGIAYDTLIHVIPKMQKLWLEIRDEGPWWGRDQ